MSKVIIKNELKLELYRDFIKSGVVPNSHGSSRVASKLKYYVENTYAHLIAEGIVEEVDDIDVLNQQFLNRQQEEFENSVDELRKQQEKAQAEFKKKEEELQNTKSEFSRGHAERMDELNSELNKLKKEMSDSMENIEKNSKTINDALDDLKKHKSISREQDKISKDLDSLFD